VTRRFAIDVRAAMRETCGIGRYSIELARALAELDHGPELLLYGASLRGPIGRGRLPADLRRHPRVRLFTPILPARALRVLASAGGFSVERATGPLAAFHHTSLVFVPGLRCPEIVTVHDLAFEVSGTFHDAGFADRMRGPMQAAITRARAVIVPSEHTRADLERRWRVDPQRLHVIPLGGDHVLRTPRGERRDPRRDPARPWFVHVGKLEPRKNLPRLVRAWRAARRRGLVADLALIGPWGWQTEELREELARGGADGEVGAEGGGEIVVRDDVSEPELRAWIEGALALVYPSLYEGFGLPVVEAFALGVPVITSNRSATREVAGEAALLVDPESEAEIADALLELARDAGARTRLASLGHERARRFTWSATARATLAVYEKATAAAAAHR
jgi:glycosyltransferase involved in cell wall biosynthesis